MKSEDTSLYEFGDYRLDLGTRQLRYQSEVIHLTPKLFELLVFLLQNPGRAISKEELLKNVWADTFVGDENLSRHISTLRKTLREGSQELEFIETLPKFGYRFNAPVRSVATVTESIPVQSNDPPSPIISDPRDVTTAASWVTQAAPQLKSQPASPFRILAPLAAGGKGEVMVAEDVQPKQSFLTRHKPRIAIVLSVSLLVFLWIGYQLYDRGNVRPAGSAHSKAMPTLIPFTSFQNRENYPAFSPDDRQLAFTWDGEKGDNTDIYVKLVDADTPLRLTTNPAVDISPVWSPDGGSIAFMRLAEDGAGIYLVPALGGVERELLRGFRSAGPTVPSGRLSWSPDGKTIVYAGTENPGVSQLHLFLLSVDGLTRRQLTFDKEDDRNPVFSPDGQTLAFIRGLDEIYVMPAAGGEARRLTFDDRRIFGLAWTPDGKEIVFSSARGGSPALWKIAATSGAPEPFRSLGEQFGVLALSHRGDRLAYAQNIRDTNIWQSITGDHSEKRVPPAPLIVSTRLETQPMLSADGSKIAFVSTRSGHWELWVCDGDGRHPVQLTSFNGPLLSSPRWSPDGKQIAFDSTASGNWDIYLISIGGGTPQRITNDSSADTRPSWSHDGQWIYFGSDRSGDFQLWKMPVAGGQTSQLTKRGGREAFESVDGQTLYYTKNPNETGIWKVPAGGGAETKVLDQGRQGDWAVGFRGIYIKQPQGSPPGAIGLFDFTTSQMTILLQIERDGANGFTVSADGRRILWAQVDRNESDIMLIEHFQN